MKLKKVMSLVLAATLAIGGIGMIPASAEEQAVPMLLQYDEPASATTQNTYWGQKGDTWQETTLPIGNGKLGANVYGELALEHLTINEETLWSAGRGTVANYNGGNPHSSMVSVYEGYANQLLNGQKVSNIENLKGLSFAESGYDKGYQALGDLYFNFSGMPSRTPSGYLRTLNLDEAQATVEFSDYSRTFFASNPDNVIVSRFTAKSGTLSFTVNFTSKQTATVNSSVSGGIGYMTIAGTVPNNGLLHNTQIAVVPENGTVSVSGKDLSVSGSTAVTVYLTAATDYKNIFWDDAHTIEYYYRTGETAAQLDTRVKGVLNSAVQKGYNAVLSAHSTDYKKLYNRVSLNLGQSNSKMTDTLLADYKKSSGGASAAERRYLETLMYQYGRYLLISASRENSQLPTNLQGIWNNSNEAPWNSDIHTNINEQMNYWLANNANLNECELPLVEYMASLAIPGHRTVETYTGSQHGIMAHTQNTPFGYTSPGWEIGTWGWSPAAATWLMQNCYDYYEFTGDTDTLRNTIYPMLKEQVLMYQDLLKEYKGRLVMPITQSPELATISAGNTYEQSLIWQLYADTIEAAQILGTDADQIATWQGTMDKLQPIVIGTSGQVKEWYEETSINSVNDTRSHRHLSNLLGLYPGNLFDSEEEINAAKVSLKNKNFGRTGTSNNPEGGWTYAQLINSYARVGDGTNAYYSVSQMIKNKLYSNLWDWHDGGNYGRFQIDANYGYTAGVGEMLLQSNLGYLNLLPAIPDEWANGSVSGLLAEGGFEVSMSWENKEIQTGSIRSTKGGECVVKLDADKAIYDESGNVAAHAGENGRATFATAAGATYTIKDYVEPECQHTNTKTVGERAATCTAEGYTGDIVCNDCGETVAQGASIKATGHSYVNGVCSKCGDRTSSGEPSDKLVIINAEKGSVSRINFTGRFTDYANVGKYNLTSHGMVIIPAAKLGGAELTVDTAGRTKITTGSFTSDGSWNYSFKISGNATEYVARAFVTWKEGGKTVYTYSDPMTVSYTGLKNNISTSLANSPAGEN